MMMVLSRSEEFSYTSSPVKCDDGYEDRNGKLQS